MDLASYLQASATQLFAVYSATEICMPEIRVEIYGRCHQTGITAAEKRSRCRPATVDVNVNIQ